MLLGYVTNGFACHRLEDALNILAELGYRSVAITLDHNHFDPFDDDWLHRAETISKQLATLDMRCTIETGARFLLDPRRKHHPTLLSADQELRDQRIAFLCRAVEIAAAMQADSVSFWSGAADDETEQPDLFRRLVAGVCDVLAHAERHSVRLSFEPEPGMYIERMAQFERLHNTVIHPLFGLTLDIGHVHCLNDGDLTDHARRWQEKIFNIHLEDMLRGTHEHLMFGQGDMNFTEIIGVLTAVEYKGPVHVELSRHSHDAPNASREAYGFLSALWPERNGIEP